MIVPPDNLLENVTTGMVIVSNLKDGSEASKRECFAAMNILLGSADYRRFGSVKEFLQYFSAYASVSNNMVLFNKPIEVIPVAFSTVSSSYIC